MKRIGISLVALGLVAALATPARAGSTALTEYKEGPSNGDASTFHDVDAGAGMITILQHNTRQPGTVHCIGEGPRATLETTHTGNPSVQRVAVDYAEAVMTEHPVIDVLVTGKKGRILGHGTQFGPLYYASGTVDVPLFAKVAKGEVMRILIGLQLHAGCLPHPFVLGLPGSRFVEGARVAFPSVSVS